MFFEIFLLNNLLTISRTSTQVRLIIILARTWLLIHSMVAIKMITWPEDVSSFLMKKKVASSFKSNFHFHMKFVKHQKETLSCVIGNLPLDDESVHNFIVILCISHLKFHKTISTFEYFLHFLYNVFSLFANFFSKCEDCEAIWKFRKHVNFNGGLGWIQQIYKNRNCFW